MMELATRAPERGLLVLVLAQIVFWTLAPALSHSAPPLDVVEMYVWGREGVVATFKHPNLPGLILEALRFITGAVGWPAYLVSQIFIAVSFWAVFALGRELMDAPRALAGAALLTGVYFFSWPTPEFNHNVAQMPLWALQILMLWRATTRGGLLSWSLLGAFAGLSLWAKYSSAVLLVVAAAWILWDKDARKRLLTPGPWVALGVFAAVAAPQVIWLMNNDFMPLAYAARRASDGGWAAPFEFLITLALDHLPMLALLAFAGFFAKAAAGAAPPEPDARALRYLLLMGAGPALLAALAALLTGSGLRASWGAPMASLSGLLAIALLNAKVSPLRLNRIFAGASVLIIAVSALYFAHMAYGAALTNRPLRGNWPQAEISRQLETAWLDATNQPLRIVAGDVWTAGLVGLEGRDPPSVIINGDLAISPWVSDYALARDGALIVWRADASPPPPLVELARGLRVQRVEVGYARFPRAPPVALNYAILPPAHE